MRRKYGAWLICALIAAAVTSYAKSPVQCSGIKGWATTMAFVHLKNAGLISNDDSDFSKTKTTLLASEFIGKDLYRQVHRIVFVKKSKEQIEVIAINNASKEECSMSGVEVFVISNHLGAIDQ